MPGGSSLHSLKSRVGVLSHCIQGSLVCIASGRVLGGIETNCKGGLCVGYSTYKQDMGGGATDL